MDFAQGQSAGAGILAGAQNATMMQKAAQATNYPTTQSQPVAPDTLLRALSQMEALNKRLSDLSLHVEEIAVAIGGPWPCDKESGGNSPTPAQPPAMMLLNAHVDTAHRRVHAIEEAVAAVRRSLGA